MRKKRILAILMVCALSLQATVASAAAVVNDETSTVTLSGVVPTKEAGVAVGIDVFGPNMDYIDLAKIQPSEIKKVMVMRNQVTSGEEGVWSLNFKIWDDPALDYDAKSGNYTAVIFSQDSKEAYRETFAYVNLEAAEKLLQSLVDNVSDLTELIKILDNNRENLGIDYPFIDKVPTKEVAALLQTEQNENGFLTNITATEGIDVVRRAVISVAVGHNAVNNLFDYTDVLKLEESDLKEFLTKDYFVMNETAITLGMNEKSVGSFSEFNDKLIEQAVLSVVKNPDGVGNVKEIVDTFATKIGITGKVTTKACQMVMGQRYSSYGELASALEKNDGNNGSNSGGRPNGSGGQSGGSGAYVPMMNVEQSEPMEYDIFSDIQDVSWAKDAIIYLAEKGIVQGKEQGKFYPNDNLTREELASILVSAFAKDAEEAETAFLDVPKDSWYYSAVAKAVSAGIATGYSDEKFGSGDFVTRQDMVTMIYRAAVSNGIPIATAPIIFADENEIADYAKEAVGALTKSKIVNGMDFNHFVPNGLSTRAEAAKVVYGLLML